jgi:hypothetical protein
MNADDVMLCVIFKISENAKSVAPEEGFLNGLLHCTIFSTEYRIAREELWRRVRTGSTRRRLLNGLPSTELTTIAREELWRRVLPVHYSE